MQPALDRDPTYRQDVNQSGREKLTALFLRHAPDAGRLAYVMTGDREAAQDILQDAFVRLFGQFRDLRNPESFQAYLRTTIVNLSRDRFRKLKAERRYAELGAPNSLNDPVVVLDVERQENTAAP